MGSRNLPYNALSSYCLEVWAIGPRRAGCGSNPLRRAVAWKRGSPARIVQGAVHYHPLAPSLWRGGGRGRTLSYDTLTSCYLGARASGPRRAVRGRNSSVSSSYCTTFLPLIPLALFRSKSMIKNPNFLLGTYRVRATVGAPTFCSAIRRTFLLPSGQR